MPDSASWGVKSTIARRGNKSAPTGRQWAPMANFAQDAASTPACIGVVVRYEWLLLDYPSPPMQVPGMYAS